MPQRDRRPGDSSTLADLLERLTVGKMNISPNVSLYGRFPALSSAGGAPASSTLKIAVYRAKTCPSDAFSVKVCAQKRLNERRTSLMRFNPDEYITVSERIEKFYAKFPQGRILTSVVEHNAETGFILIRAEVYRDAEAALPAATGHAYELRSAGHVQAGSYVEVCETSSVGRALALLGFEGRRGGAGRAGVIRGARKQQAAAPAPPAERPAPERTPAAAATPSTPTKP